MTNISDVIGWKFNHQPGMTVRGNEITEFPGTMPTDAEIATYTAEYEAHLADTQYQRDRDYGSVQDQLDMIYWDQVNGTTKFKDHAASVKVAHPKPGV